MYEFPNIRLSVEKTLAKLPSDVASAERIHTEGVAECAQILADVRGQNPTLAWVAGMLHDMGRIQAGENTKQHGKIGADLSRILLSEMPGLNKKERERIGEAIRHHVRKNRIDNPLSELLKDADAWQLAQKEGTFGQNPYRRTRAMLADTQRKGHASASDVRWPPLKQPGLLAEAMAGECRQLSLALAPFLDDKQILHISRHAVHALRQQARRTVSLLTYLSPLLPTAPYSTMLAAVRAVLSAIGPVRDADVLLAWFQKTFSPEALPNPPETPDVMEAVPGVHAAMHCLWRIREKRLEKAATQVRQHRSDFVAFSSEDAFSSLARLPSQALAAFHAEQSAIFRRSLSKTAASLIRKVEGKEKPDRLLHKFRLHAKSAHTILMTMYETSEGTDPCYPALMDALEEIRILLGEWQDAVVGTALLQKVTDRLSKKKKHSTEHASLIAIKWNTHVVRISRRMKKNAHSLLFILQKLL